MTGNLTEVMPSGVPPGLRTRIGALFTTAPAPRAGWRAGVLGGCAVVAGMLLGLVRQGGHGATDTIWAEDGVIFLTDAVDKSFLAALVTPYAGYFQVLPRLLAEPVQFLPAQWAAFYLATVAALATSVLGLVVYVASAAYLRPQLARVLVAAVTVVVPAGGVEVSNAVCNVHWAGLYALFWVLLWVPASRVGRASALVVAVLIAATNILAVVFLPLALARGIGRRDAHSRALASLVTFGVGLHLLGLLVGTATRHVSGSVADAAASLFTDVLPGALLGEDLMRATGASAGERAALLVLAGGLLVVAVLVAVCGWTRPDWRVATLALTHACLFWTVAAGAGGASPRYTATPTMLVVGALVALMLPIRPGVRGIAPLVALTLLLATVATVNLRVESARAEGPSWRAEVAQARAECLRTGDESVELEISPPPNWVTRIACSYLLRWS